MKYFFIVSIILLTFNIINADAFYSNTLEEYAPVQTTGERFPNDPEIPKFIDPAEATYTVDFNGIPGKKAVHEGMDYVHNDRSKPHIFVKAAADGKVVYIRTGCPQSSMFNRNTLLREAGAGWGVHVVIHHGNNVYTRYAHLSPHSVKVNTGDTVSQGEIIAEMGNTGRSEVRHLHFEIGYKKDPFITNKPAQSFDLVFDPEFFISNTQENYAVVSADDVNVRKGPSTSYDIITNVSKGTKLIIIEKNNDWYKIKIVENNITGYIWSKLIVLTSQRNDSSYEENIINDAVIQSLQIFDSGKYNIFDNNDLSKSVELVEAIKVLNNIVYNNTFKNDSKSRYFLAKLYILQGNFEAGKRWLKDSGKLESNNEYSWNSTWGKHASSMLNSLTDTSSAAHTSSSSSKTDNYYISEKGKTQLRNIVTYAKTHNNGASNGYCFNSVWKYMTSSGYGKLNSWWDLPNMKSSEARHLAEYLNASASHLKEAGLQRLDTLLSPKIVNPHDDRIPDGAIIVVAAGSTGTYHATAGDVTVKAGTKFINDGPNMYYGKKANWTGKILGIYIPE